VKKDWPPFQDDFSQPTEFWIHPAGKKQQNFQRALQVFVVFFLFPKNPHPSPEQDLRGNPGFLGYPWILRVFNIEPDFPFLKTSSCVVV